MKKKIFMLFASLSLLLGGCSLLEEANNSLKYANDATDYVNQAAAFAEKVPTLAEKALTDKQAVQELKTELESMKQEIQSFSELKAPKIAEDLHNKILEQNKRIDAQIDVYLNDIQDGKLDPKILENSELNEPIQEIKGIIDQITKLGN